MDAILISLFRAKNRTIKVNIEGEIIKINNENELVSIDVRSNNYDLKGLTFYKIDLFPNPVKGDLILIDNISYKYDEHFNPIILIHANIKGKKTSSINIINKLIFDFGKDNIIDTLKNKLNMNKKLKSNLFVYKDSNDENYYKLKCLENNEIYFINKKNDIFEYNLNTKNIIYIKNYEEEHIIPEENTLSNKFIRTTMLSFIEIMNEENLFILLENQEEISNKYLWGKIVEKDEKNKTIKFMDGQKRILKFKTYLKNVELGQYCLFSDYIIKNNMIELKDNSFSYFSAQSLYFSNKINFNKFSVVQFHFLDYKEKENIFNVIHIDGNSEENIIINNHLEIIINTNIMNSNYKLIPIKMQLKEYQGSIDNKEFYIDILQGLLTKINLQINYKSENSFSYEYLYMFFNETNIYNKTKLININNEEIKINIFDNFDSKNRIRFNIVNIPFQNEFDQKIPLKDINYKNNSFLVCETFKNDSISNIFGIFNLYEIHGNIPFPFNKNKIFNVYYNNFGNIYDTMKKPFSNDEALEFIEKCKNIISGEKMLFDEILIFDEEITISQLKTRMGILISYYLNEDKTFSEQIDNFRDIQKFVYKIESIKNKFSYNQILRIFYYLLRRNIKQKKNTNLILLSELKQDSYSPYYLAINFNLEEIKNINEYSKLFQGYLQMDSYILYNHKNDANSYSLSIEPFFIVKYHLNSNYEGFFFTEEINNNIIAWTEAKENIIVFNEENLFEKSKYKDIKYIENVQDSKNHAFGISMVFRHESNSYKKKNLKSKLIASPIYYCDDGDIKQIQYKEGNVFKDEDGIMIESLIMDDQEKILSLAKDFIYGELLDCKYFIKKDFKELIKQIDIIREKNKDYFSNSNKFNDIIRKTLKSGTLEFGDQFYTLDLVEEMVALAEKKGHLEQLPLIFIEVEKALKESKKKG